MTTTAPEMTILDVIVDAKTVLDVLKDCKKAIGIRSTLPVLEHVLLTTDAQTDTLTLTATNLEIVMSRTIPNVQVNYSGSICLPHKPLMAFVKNCKKGEALDIIVHENESTDITRFHPETRKDLAHITLRGMDAKEFPCIPSIPEDVVAVTLRGTTLQSLVKQTVFACAKNNVRPVFTGIHLVIDGLRIRAEGADTYRITHQEAELLASTAAQGPLPLSLLVPGTALSAIAAMFQPQDEVTLSFALDTPMLFVTSSHFTACSHLIEAIYPNVDALMSNYGKQDSWIACHRDDLLSFLEGFQGTQSLECTLSADHLTLQGTVTDDDLGTQQGGCLIQTGMVQPDATRFLFNRAYLLEGVKAFPKGSLIEIKWNKPTDHPFFLQSSDMPGFQYIIMPLYSRG